MYPIIHIFNYSIPTFSLFFILGIGLGFPLAFLTGKKYALPSLDVLLFGVYAIIGGVLGAKLLYIIVAIPVLINNPNLIFDILKGGAVFYGGLLGGVIGGYGYSKIYKLDVLKYFDIAVPCIALAHGFGRIGCFFNGCCYGIAYDGFGAIHFPPGGYPPSDISLFPSQPVEAFFLFILCFVLIFILRKSHTPGITTASYLLLYGFFRLINEYFRSDPRGSFLFFSTSQYVSFFIIAAGFFLIYKCRHSLK